MRYLESLGPGGMNFDLGRTRVLVRRLGDPQDRFPAVHVAGTNGKGSVCAMIASALRRTGLRVGVYTSPHLERINERFSINGDLIPDATLNRLSRRIESLKEKPTQFEALTAIAFLWFAEEAVDIAVIEVGLGGRLDTTNVLGHVAVSVITNIGFDHMAWLGNTIPAIAREKAGIVRPHTPVVTAATGPALDVIRAAAMDAGSPLTVVDHPYRGPVGLAGAHQRTNAAVAAAALERLDRLGYPVPAPAIQGGIAAAQWPGRFERFTLGAGQNRITVLLDGAHNVPAAEALAATVRGCGSSGLTLVFGALKDKDVAGVSKVLAPLAQNVVTVAAPSDRAVPAGTLAKLPAWNSKAVAAGSMDEALKDAIVMSNGRPILVTGSLYVVGALRGRLNSLRRNPS